jgi:PTS system mannose-specific IIC component
MANELIIPIISVCFAGGILCLDRVVGQFMFSRPIVAAPVIGLILGDLETGLIAGTFIELFWIDRLPLGIYLPPNDTLVAILIAAAAILTARTHGQSSPGLISFCVLLFSPLGILAQRLECRNAGRNEQLARKALHDAKRGDARSIAAKHLLAVARHLFLTAGLILVALPAGIALTSWLYPQLPPFAVRGLTLLYGLLPLLGVSVALNQNQRRGAIPLFCAVFLAATILIGFIRGS